MSDTPKPRRPLRLQGEVEPAEVKPWQVRTPDGRVRGPLGIAQICALAEVGILTTDTVVAAAEGETDTWLPIEEHPIWDQVRTAFPREKLKSTTSGVPFPTEVGAAPIPQEITPAMQARLTEAKHREIDKLWRGMMLGQLAWVLRCVREGAIFLGFVTTGDLFMALIPSSLGIVRWGALMAVMAVALGYYILKGLGK